MADKRLERVLPVPRWPTREEAAALDWFAPGKIGSITTSDRTWVPAMVPWRATEDGFVTPAVRGWYQRFAQGRPAVIVVEATGVRDIPSGPLLRIGHDRFIEGLRELVETVREASEGRTRLFIQLIRLPDHSTPTDEGEVLRPATSRSITASGSASPSTSSSPRSPRRPKATFARGCSS